MSKTDRTTNPAARPEPPADGAERSATSKTDYIRIARALIGTTPAQLAAQIGARPDVPTAQGAGDPAQTPERLAMALRIVIGWYEDRFATKPGAGRREVESETEELGDLVKRYIALRADWEARQAVRLAAAMREESRGVTAARIILQAPSAAPPHVAPAPPVAAPLGDRRRALLVDDASDVVVTVGAFLESFGFDVVRASSGDMALQLLADGVRMDLLVTDHAMPEMKGRDLVTLARQQRAGIRALIITGYPDASELGDLPAGVFLLAKPFRRAELSARIASMFETKPAAEAAMASGEPQRSN